MYIYMHVCICVCIKEITSKKPNPLLPWDHNTGFLAENNCKECNMLFYSLIDCFVACQLQCRSGDSPVKIQDILIYVS